MTIDKRTITTSSGIHYEIENCHKMLNRFPEESDQYAFAFRILVELKRKASNLNFEGETFII